MVRASLLLLCAAASVVAAEATSCEELAKAYSQALGDTKNVDVKQDTTLSVAKFCELYNGLGGTASEKRAALQSGSFGDFGTKLATFWKKADNAMCKSGGKPTPIKFRDLANAMALEEPSCPAAPALDAPSDSVAVDAGKPPTTPEAELVPEADNFDKYYNDAKDQLEAMKAAYQMELAGGSAALNQMIKDYEKGVNEETAAFEGVQEALTAVQTEIGHLETELSRLTAATTAFKTASATASAGSKAATDALTTALDATKQEAQELNGKQVERIGALTDLLARAQAKKTLFTNFAKIINKKDKSQFEALMMKGPAVESEESAGGVKGLFGFKKKVTHDYCTLNKCYDSPNLFTLLTEAMEDTNQDVSSVGEGKAVGSMVNANKATLDLSSVRQAEETAKAMAGVSRFRGLSAQQSKKAAGRRVADKTLDAQGDFETAKVKMVDKDVVKMAEFLAAGFAQTDEGIKATAAVEQLKSTKARKTAAKAFALAAKEACDAKMVALQANLEKATADLDSIRDAASSSLAGDEADRANLVASQQMVADQMDQLKANIASVDALQMEVEKLEAFEINIKNRLGSAPGAILGCYEMMCYDRIFGGVTDTQTV